MISNWPATEKWTKSNFTSLYGNKSINIGSQSLLAYGRGRDSAGGLSGILRDILSNMTQKSKSMKNNDENHIIDDINDDFVFDLDILQSIPELKNDFRVPGMFRYWDNVENDKTGVTRHYLSLGPSQTGLPFHTHGSTWLGLVYGMKRWFIYPPGASPPPLVERTHNPLRTILNWYLEIYPKLTNLDYPPIHGNLPVEQGIDFEGYRPLECVQRAGDIMFVPAGWTHGTMNIGDTVGIGGQSSWGLHRLSSSMEAIRSSPYHFEALKNAAHSLLQLGMEEESRILKQIKSTEKGMVQLKIDNFDSIVLQGIYVYIRINI
jgi:hypothetical protein